MIRVMEDVYSTHSDNIYTRELQRVDSFLGLAKMINDHTWENAVLDSSDLYAHGYKLVSKEPNGSQIYTNGRFRLTKYGNRVSLSLSSLNDERDILFKDDDEGTSDSTSSFNHSSDDFDENPPPEEEMSGF